MHNEEQTNDLGIIAHLAQLVNRQGTARDYFTDRNNFINHCIKSKSLRLIASIMPVALTALWYFSLDIYRHLLPYEKQQNSIVLQHNDPYFIGIVFFFFFVLVVLLIALNLYSASILTDRRRYHATTFTQLSGISKTWILLNCLFSQVTLFCFFPLLGTTAQEGFQNFVPLIFITLLIAASFYHMYCLLPNTETCHKALFCITCLCMIPAMFFGYTDLVDYLPFSESIIFAIVYFALFYGSCNSLWFFFACIFTRMNLRRFTRTSPSAPTEQEDTTRSFKLYIAQDLVFLCLVILAETYLIIYIMLILFYEIDTFGKGFFELAFYWLMIQQL